MCDRSMFTDNAKSFKLVPSLNGITFKAGLLK